MQYATVKYNQKEQKQSTCDSIVSGTENAKNNSECIGDKANQIMHNTGQSTIQQPTTKTQEKNSEKNTSY